MARKGVYLTCLTPTHADRIMGLVNFLYQYPLAPARERELVARAIRDLLTIQRLGKEIRPKVATVQLVGKAR